MGDRWRWQWQRWPTNWLPVLQAALSTFMHSGCATDSRLVLVALMVWLPWDLQLPLCPISVMDELCLIYLALSHLYLYVGPWPAGWLLREKKEATPRHRGPYRIIQPGKMNLWSQVRSDCRGVWGHRFNKHQASDQDDELAVIPLICVSLLPEESSARQSYRSKWLTHTTLNKWHHTF